MRRLGLLGLLAALAASSALAQPTCREALQIDPPAALGPVRDLTRDDLVRLRDFGGSYQVVGQKLAAVSPDGTKLALQVRRADPLANRYCMGVLVLDLTGAAAPRWIDVGGDYVLRVFQTADYGAAPDGSAPTLVPSWSPDGRALVYLRRDGGVTQVWRAPLEGTAMAVTHGVVDVEAAAFVDEGAIVCAVRPGLTDAAAHIEAAGASGYLYDDRFDPDRSQKPRIPGVGPIYLTLDLATGATRPARPDEQTRLAPPPTTAPGAWSLPLSEDQRRPTGERDPAARLTRSGLRVQGRSWTATCTLVVCDGVRGAWLDAHDTVIFVKPARYAATQTQVYRWRRGQTLPELVLESPSRLLGCDLTTAGLVCAAETATQPRRLVLIDPKTGHTRVLLDPNPEFGHLRLGRTIALRWTDDAGFETAGTLVLPPQHRPGDRWPLVVVQYVNTGFLRGGTGDEYPIHLLAAQGLAVLATNDPRPLSDLGPLNAPHDAAAMATAAYRDWAERRHIEASLEAGLRTVIGLGVIDPTRIGISGFSAGGQTVEWALIHSRRFAAAALSHCCNDRYVTIYGSQLYVRQMRAANGGQDFPSRAAYDAVSLEANPQAVEAPLLLQMSDRELIRGLPTLASLQAADKPVELYVYPDEFHNKWQPAHRAEIYQRAVDWFGFWLAGRIDPDPSKAAQYDRWRAMRARRDGRSAAATEPAAADPSGTAVRSGG